MPRAETETSELLVIAGISEIEKHGIQNLSMRRVASECGVSCAAPYKHYKNKNDFVLAIIQYINSQWSQIQEEVIKKAEKRKACIRELLTDISLAYIKFLVDHPNFRSIILMNDNAMTPEQLKEKASVSKRTDMLIHEYCNQVNMSLGDRIRKTFVVRSLIYGAAYLMGSGELEKDEQNYQMVREAIQREFDLI